MLLSLTEIETMKSHYPDEKPTVFNFIQAREDFLQLVEAYNTLLKSSAPSNLPCQSDKKKFIVLIDSDYVRDAQILPENHYPNEDDDDGNPIDNSSAWKDFEAEMLVGIFTVSCGEDAIYEASRENEISTFKLIAYQIAD